jgi:hypothetical protein
VLVRFDHVARFIEKRGGSEKKRSASVTSRPRSERMNQFSELSSPEAAGDDS